MGALIEPEGLIGQFHLGAISTVLTGLLSGAMRELANQLLYKGAQVYVP